MASQSVLLDERTVFADYRQLEKPDLICSIRPFMELMHPMNKKVGSYEAQAPFRPKDTERSYLPQR